MSRSGTIRASRKARREEFRRKARRQKIITSILLIVGVLLVGWGSYTYITRTQENEDLGIYAPEDVVYDRPIQAVHEMGDGPPIPFLPSDEAQPTILVPDNFENIGTVGPQDVVTRKFIIWNTGDAPLTISRAYTTCGCTTAEISASVIPPGKVAEVTLVIDVGFHDVAGQTVRRGLIIENNDPSQSQAEIWVQANVRNN
jgi:hypothetical protein